MPLSVEIHKIFPLKQLFKKINFSNLLIFVSLSSIHGSFFPKTFSNVVWIVNIFLLVLYSLRFICANHFRCCYCCKSLCDGVSCGFLQSFFVLLHHHSTWYEKGWSPLRPTWMPFLIIVLRKHLYTAKTL